MPAQWQLDRSDRTPLYRQIVRVVSDRIESGELPPGTKLPPERELAEQLRVNRSTVMAAYQELVALALVSARVGSGRVVSARASAPGGPDWDTYIAGGTLKPDPALGQEVALTRQRPGILSLTSGQVSADLFPTAQLTALMRSADLQGVPLGYGDVQGYFPLRQVIAERTGVAAESVQIINGAQQGFQLIAAGLLEAGDTIAVEAPSYINHLSVLQSAPVRVLPVPVDGQGMDVAHLESLLARRRVHMVLVQPSYHNPTGTTMPLERRQLLLRLCQKQRIPLVEDDPYGDLWLDGPSIPTIKSLDRTGTVLYLSSVSKTIAAGMRLGWISGPTPVLARLAAVKLQLDQGTDILNQWIAYRFIHEGVYATHVERLRAELRRRRNSLIAALESLGALVSFAVPAGGYHLWMRCNVRVRSGEIFREAARQGLAVMPGAVYGEEAGGLPHLRLTFAHVTAGQAMPAVERLGAVLRGLR